VYIFHIRSVYTTQIDTTIGSTSCQSAICIGCAVACLRCATYCLVIFAYTHLTHILHQVQPQVRGQAHISACHACTRFSYLHLASTCQSAHSTSCHCCCVVSWMWQWHLHSYIYVDVDVDSNMPKLSLPILLPADLWGQKPGSRRGGRSATARTNNDKMQAEEAWAATCVQGGSGWL
jgi:hypothetical protein